MDDLDPAIDIAPLPSVIRANPIRSAADWQAMAEAAAADPGAFHGAIAARLLHWYHPDLGAWLSQGADGRWTGVALADGRDVALDDWAPWHTAFDDRAAPVYRWFAGGLTNAAFNEVDRHVLAGHGAEAAYHYEGDRWDPSANQGRGGPVHTRRISRRDLLIDSVAAARALADLGLGPGDRIALNLPNIPEQIIWTEAAKRLGIIYTPVFGGFSDKTLADRIENAGACVVITADGASRNAETVPFKEVYTDPALDRFVAVAAARDVAAVVLAARVANHAAVCLAALDRALAGEITATPADIMQALGRALGEIADLPASTLADLRADLAEALARAPRRVRHVIVVNHARIADLAWVPERDLWAHDLLARAVDRVAAEAGVAGRAGLDALADRDLALRLGRAMPCRPLDANTPLFIIYTSGSTGKPKGVVHVHGGYVAGIAHTMTVSFDAVDGEDVIYVVADPGWITGQSYLITASLTRRITGILTEGSPVFPNAGRFASIIERYGVTIFKAGVTFLKTVMSDPENRADVEAYDRSSLRVATFCAEPTSPAVQRFAMQLMTRQYINSYWATEHGGIVWTHPYGNPDQPLRADAHTWALPWVAGDVWVPAGDTDADGRVAYRRAEDGERGEIVITRPYPYLAFTLWGDGDRAMAPGWVGDRARFRATYYGRFRDADGQPVPAYLQGDFAVRHGDGSFTLHGRSDDVINVSGHRMGTEEIEGAILRDRQINPDSPVGNCVVVGAPHGEKGLTPVAFIRTAAGRALSADDQRRLAELVRQDKGAVAVPSDFIAVPDFPETRSGKYMRRLLAQMMAGAALGDTTTLRNPEVLGEIEGRVGDWRRRQARLAVRDRLETTRSLRVEYDPAGAVGDRLIATVTIANPPVNALSERVLDELSTLADHLLRRADIGAIVLAGAGAGTFVAGADIRQLVEEVHDEAEAQAVAAKAHGLFRRLEAAAKPVIAVLDGVALGGGAELAAACHLRLATERTRIGQPEINLFLPPGFGGTQRWPRLLMERAAAAGGDPAAALVSALALLLSGRAVEVGDAVWLGLVDRMVTAPADALSQARALAREAVAHGTGPAVEAMQARHAAITRWQAVADGADALVDRALGDAYVRLCLAQSDSVGRGPVARAIVDLVRQGFRDGYLAGLAAESRVFARFVVDGEAGGRRGIRLFLDKQSPPLPARPRPAADPATCARLVEAGRLLPIGSPFVPGVTPLPDWQCAYAVVRDPATGAARHGDPAEAEVEALVPVPDPGPTEALVYVLASEVNYNDVWAVTGLPISVLDDHDEDVHVSGSGGVGLIVRLGEALQAEGRLAVGDVVAIYAGVSDLMDPEAGADPMATRFHIQGYQTPDGSHRQFMTAQGPQLFAPPGDLSLEAAGSYMLAGGTAYRALFRALGVTAGSGLLVEGAASGTGQWAVAIGRAAGARVVGLVSGPARRAAVEATGAAAVDRRADALAGLFTRVPADPAAWDAWAAAGRPWLDAVAEAHGGRLVDFALSHAGETAFPRSFQALGEGGVITFFGASTGHHMTFLGKPGGAEPAAMLARAGLRPGEAVVVFYGVAGRVRDETALAAIEAARRAGGRIVVVTDGDDQRDFVASLGYGDAVVGVVSLAEIARRVPQFRWPETMPDLPDLARDTAGFKETVRRMTEDTFKPLGAAIGRLLRSADNPRGQPDIVVERARTDSLAYTTMLVRPHTGRVVYCGDMGGRRYSFYAPQVWMRQRRILMPTAAIVSSHLNSAAEIAALNRMIAGGAVTVPPVHLGAWHDLPALHQAMYENHLDAATGGFGKAVVNHALPEPGLKTRDELLLAWAQAAEA